LEYKEGFGKPTEANDFWLGLEAIHRYICYDVFLAEKVFLFLKLNALLLFVMISCNISKVNLQWRLRAKV